MRLATQYGLVQRRADYEPSRLFCSLVKPTNPLKSVLCPSVTMAACHWLLNSWLSAGKMSATTTLCLCDRSSLAYWFTRWGVHKIVGVGLLDDLASFRHYKRHTFSLSQFSIPQFLPKNIEFPQGEKHQKSIYCSFPSNHMTYVWSTLKQFERYWLDLPVNTFLENLTFDVLF